jgi:hypothetical protein
MNDSHGLIFGNKIAGSCKISVMASARFMEEQVFWAVVDELVDYFSDARVTGIVISESEARTIAVGITRRLDSLIMSTRPHD